jgi:hypothetical protein
MSGISGEITHALHDNIMYMKLYLNGLQIFGVIQE